MKRALTWLIIGILISSITDLQVSAQTDQKKTRPKVGLVLSGGGAKGFAHVGVLKAINEAGIQIDYVGGTSIGSIIGAMYAAGYTPEEMDSMIRRQDWTQLIQDKFPRKKLSIQEKGLDEEFFVSFPIKPKKGLSLPQSVVQGQEVMNLLEQLFLPVFKTRNFEDLEIPFLCIGTDLVTGNAITLDTGNLAHAVRASMSIPSYFAPTKYGNYYLVDGGVVNNYPVMNVIGMGADIIIGIDVQSPPKTIEELNTVVSVITQIVEYHSKPAGDIARAHTDISITPDISGYDMMSFTSYDTLLARGYKAGKKALPELIALKERLDKYDELPTEHKRLEPIDSLYITDVQFEGLEWLNEKFMDGQIKFEWPAWIQTSELNDLISTLLSTRFFQSLRYDILPVKGGNVLIFHIKEASARTISFGIHYDSYYEASINLLGTFRNWLIDGSKMTTALSLGTNPLILGDYFVNRGYRPGPGISIVGEVIDLNIYEEGQTTEIKRFSTAEFELYGKSTLNSVMELGIGTSIEYTNHNTKVGLIPDEGNGQFFANAKFFLNLDTYNHLNFPTNGWQTRINSEYIYGLKEESNQETSVFFQRVTIRKASPLGNKLTLIASADVGFSIGSVLPTQNRFFFGGLETRSLNGLVSFMGSDFLERKGEYMYVGKANLQWDIHANKHYATLSLNVGNINADFEDVFEGNTLLVGYGITYSYNSLVGPLSFTLMTSNRDPILGMLSLGFKI